MSDIYLHIGLHKTATKYFQHHVFPFLDQDKFIYNPAQLSQYIMDFIKADPEDRAPILKALAEEKAALQTNNPGKTILISREIMCGDLFCAYRFWDESITLLHQGFPEAKIIMSMRFQPDWLVSAYRESFHEHHYQTIEDFLCYDKSSGEFAMPDSCRNENGFANLYALNLDYTRMLDVLFEKFPRERVFLTFYEYFKTRAAEITKDVLDFIGSEMVETKPVVGIPNRGFSANSIKLSLERSEELKKEGRESEIHRPIFFYGPNSIPAGNIEISLLDKNKYWGPQFLRDNEEVRSPNYPNLTPEEKEAMEKSWRYHVKNVIDVKEYKDWDLLGDLRPKLEEAYCAINEKLTKYIRREDIPSKFFSGTSVKS